MLVIKVNEVSPLKGGYGSHWVITNIEVEMSTVVMKAEMKVIGPYRAQKLSSQLS